MGDIVPCFAALVTIGVAIVGVNVWVLLAPKGAFVTGRVASVVKKMRYRSYKIAIITRAVAIGGKYVTWLALCVTNVTDGVTSIVIHVLGSMGDAAYVTLAVTIVIVYVLDASSFLAHVTDAVAIVVVRMSRTTIRARRWIA